jgi:predicted MPP superfamily phosphohydrolase
MLNRPPTNKRRSRGLIRWLIDSITKLLVVLLIVLTYIFHVEPNWYDVHEVTLTLPHLPAAFDRYRIVQLTDLHVDNLKDVSRLQKMVELTSQNHPNLIVMTGDYISNAVFTKVVPRQDPKIKPLYDKVLYLKILDAITLAARAYSKLSAEKYIPTLSAGLKNIQAPDGILAILGNHDLWDWHAPTLCQISRRSVSGRSNGSIY